MKLYHGTNLSSAFNICVNGINLSYSEKYLDFGAGFYTTDCEWKAKKRAWQKTNEYNRRNKTNEPAYIVELMIDFSQLYSYNVMEFNGHDLDWCRFVLNNRLDSEYLNKNNNLHHNRDNKYDVVIGEIADGKIADIAYNIRSGKLDINNVNYSSILTDDQTSYGNQISFHTEKSLSCIVSITCDIIKERNDRKVANSNDKTSKRI